MNRFFIFLILALAQILFTFWVLSPGRHSDHSLIQVVVCWISLGAIIELFKICFVDKGAE